jgi:hypothetical protein
MLINMLRNIKKSTYYTIFSYIILFLVCLSLFSWWQASDNFPDPDAFYHMKMAELTSQQGIITSFPWMQYTVLKDYYVDHHLLYHILLIPFITILSPLYGIKISVILFATSFIVGFSLLLHAWKIKYSAFYGLVMALTIPLMFRLNLVKANSLSLLVLFLGFYFACKKKYVWLFFLSLIYVWTYGGFILLLCVTGSYLIIDFIYHKKIGWQTLLSIFLGFAAGIIINPYFPKNILFYWQQLVQIGIINYQDKIGVGGEWYPYGLVELLSGCSLVTILVFVSLILFFIFIKKQNSLSWCSLFLFIIGLILVLKSRRYIEYYVPFSIFFIANALNVFFAQYSWLDLKNILVKFWQKNIVAKLILFVVTVYFSLIIPAIIVKDCLRNRDDLRSGIPYEKFSQASQWLMNNTPAGSIVLHSDWDEFPDLFYYNSHNYYIVGLDPTFMYNYNKDLYWKWVNITIGKQKDNLPHILREDFHASYVFLEKDHTEMDSNLQQYDELELVYDDEEAKIYKVKGEE